MVIVLNFPLYSLHSGESIDIIVKGLETEHVSHGRIYFMESTIHALTD